jgi:isopenicillin-N N-acyltransferase like protein
MQHKKIVQDSRVPVLQRSDVILSLQQERKVVSQASLEVITSPASLTILVLKGTPYEMGYQHGKLLSEEVRLAYNKTFNVSTKVMNIEILDEVYDLMEPYIPLEEKEEMRGLAHGAGIPLRVVHRWHAIPEVSEFSGRRKLRVGWDGTSCTNYVVMGEATESGEMIQVRILDWVREFGMQELSTVIIRKPLRGLNSACFSYAGFVGCVTGMNESRITIGEKGDGDPPGENLRGMPFVFLFRKILREARSLEQAIHIVRNAKRTCAYWYTFSDGKTREAVHLMTDREQVRLIGFNEAFSHRDGTFHYPPMKDAVFGGARPAKLVKSMQQSYGGITAQIAQKMNEDFSGRGNLQNVVMRPEKLDAWIANASLESGEKGKACYQPYIYFDFKKYLD